MSRASRGYLIAMVGVAFWSSSAILISYLVDNYRLAPLQLAFWRDTLVCVGVGAGLFATRRLAFHPPRGHIRFLLAYGLVLSLFNSIWTLAVKLVGAAAATVLVYSSAGFTVLLSRWLYGERLGTPKVLAVVLSLAGCVLVSGAYDPRVWQAEPLGIIVGLLSGLLFALYSLLGRENEERELDTWGSMLVTFAVAAVLLLLYSHIPILERMDIATTRILPDLPLQGWVVLVTLAFIPTLLGYGLYNASMKYLPVGTVNLLATAEPALTAVQAYIVLSERMTAPQIGGGGLIIVSLLLVRLTERRDRCVQPDPTPKGPRSR